MKKDYAIKFENVTKVYKQNTHSIHTLKDMIILKKQNKIKNKVVLDNISFRVNKGEKIGIIGTNGSGKSTILKLISQIIYPTKGKILTNGSITSLIELGAGFHEDFTGRENIYFNASIHGLSKKEIDKKIEDIIAFSELQEAIDSPVRTYSTGMYIRLGFSIAVNIDADIILIDEILSVGDINFQQKSLKKLMELSKQNKTFIVVSHDLNTLSKICDRTIWVDNNQIVMDDKTSKVISEYNKKQLKD